MFRKLVLAAATVAALGAASLAPTAASAHGWHKGHGHGHWHGHFHKHWGVYPVYGGYGGGCYFVRKFVPTPYGVVKKRVMVCG